jgi:hypothetical protein
MARFGIAAFVATAVALATAETYTWKNVNTGAGGGWVGNVVFNPSKKGLGMHRMVTLVDRTTNLSFL